jgi:hypothetical protein
MIRAGLLTRLLAAVLMTVQGAAARPIPGWGDPIDPDGDCDLRLEGRALALTVPGTPHELRAESGKGKRNAPRVLRDVEGHFVAQVKVTGDLGAGDVPVVSGPVASRSAGLVLWQDERNFVRLERIAGRAPDGERPRDRLLLEYWKDGQLQDTSPGSGGPLPRGRTTWLRLTRRMDKLKAEASQDGETWTEVKTIPIRLSSRLRLGVMATNTSGRPLGVQFEAFQLKSIPLYP